MEVIRASDWYNTDKPETDEGQLWECRTAMLDAIFYQPKIRKNLAKPKLRRSLFSIPGGQCETGIAH